MSKPGEEGGASLLLYFLTSSDDELVVATRRMYVARRLVHIGGARIDALTRCTSRWAFEVRRLVHNARHDSHPHS